MSGTSSGAELAALLTRLAELQGRRAAIPLDIADGVQQVRMPDGSGVTYGSVADRIASIEPLDREIGKLEAQIASLKGTLRRPKLRQVRFVTGKGL